MHPKNLRKMEANKISTLIEAIIKKGLPYDAYSCVVTQKTYIGLQTHPRGWKWHWFSGYCLDGSTAYLFFDHTYNCNTGGLNKGWKHGYGIRRRIEQLTGIFI
jgi:hypothetical protein